MATAPGSGRIDIGGVLSRAFVTIGRNFPAFLGLSLLLGGLPAFTFSYLAGGEFGVDSPLGFSAGGAASGAWVVHAVASAFLDAVIVRSSILSLSGRGADISGSVVTAMGLILPLIGLTLLCWLVLLIGLVLLIVPGIIAYVALMVVVPVLVEERRGVTECMERSAALTKGSRWYIFLLLLILGFAYLVLGAALVAAAVSAGGEALQYGIEALVVSLSSLVMSAMTAALYVELRTVKEGATTDGLAEIFA